MARAPPDDRAGQGCRGCRCAGGGGGCGDRRHSALRPAHPPPPVVSAADVVTSALDALRARDWAAFARRLHPDVVHRTPGVPEPILGRDAFLLLSQQAVARTPDVTFEVERLVSQGETVVVIGEWTYTGPQGRVRQPSVSVVDLKDGMIWRDLEYVGLQI
ncbi:MAG: nuclear transport factor 2 family protein [Chloroflexi bacterium]|nr:MAG: nuclear transport factor 2 family protein [Chloroflexota bacterium]